MKKILGFLLLGITLRLIFAVFFNHVYDFFNILALVKSQAETGSLIPGFFVLKRFGIEAQLYGKLYYQIAAIWLEVLQKLKIVEIKYLFDNKAFTNQETYMAGFRYWGPPLYQLTAIKLIQFLYDGLLVYFLYKLGEVLEIKNKSLLVLFWALNPFFIIIGYAMFQADLAMTACLVAGLYFWVKALKNTSGDVYLALLFFALGAVIKQVPLLLIPLVIISCAKSLRHGIVLTVSAALLYWIAGQPWSGDANLLKLFFLNSGESTMLFKLNFNGIPLFYIFYFSLLVYVLLKKTDIFTNPISPVVLSIVTIVIVYLCEDGGFFFPQFNIWIMPLVAILALQNKRLSLLLLIPAFSFFKRYLGDIDTGTRLLAPAIGSWYGDIPTLSAFLKSVTNTQLLELTLHSISMYLYGLLGVVAFLQLMKTKVETNFSKILSFFTFSRTVLFIFFLFVILLIGDFTLRSRYVKLPSAVYEETQVPVAITRKPISITINNSAKTPVNAIQFFTQRKVISDNSPIVFKFKNDTSVIQEEKINPYLLPEKPSYFTLFLHRSISSNNFTVEISQPTGKNEIVLFKPQITSTNPLPGHAYLNGYDKPFTTVNYVFNNQPVTLRVLGTYNLQTVLTAWNYNWQTKPKFFLGYLSLTIVLLISSGYVLYTSKKHS